MRNRFIGVIMKWLVVVAVVCVVVPWVVVAGDKGGLDKELIEAAGRSDLKLDNTIVVKPQMPRKKISEPRRGSPAPPGIHQLKRAICDRQSTVDAWSVNTSQGDV